jgi:photosystem II stability/assembly factor-like uncharacterized protein
MNINTQNFTLLFYLTLMFVSNLFSQGYEHYRVDDSNTQTKRLSEINPSYKSYTPELINDLYKLSQSMPIDANRNEDEWVSVGPQKILGTPATFFLSGRVRDVNVVNDSLIRFAAASGGLWESKLLSNGNKQLRQLTHFNIPVVTGGAVATDPFDEDIILYGTGETAVRAGSGFYRSENGGETWTKVNFPQNASTYCEIEYSYIKNKVWCTSETGVYKSLNNGKTWQFMRAGFFPGLAIDPYHPDTVYVGQQNGTILKSTNGGKNWVSLGAANGLPTSNVERIELSLCEKFPNVLYAFYTNDNNLTLGLYRSDDYGNSWTTCKMFDNDGNPVSDIHWGQGWYNSFVSVSPVDPNKVLAGGGWYIVSTDGINFIGPITSQHPDFHSADWSNDGSKVYVCNDGGVYGTVTDNQYKWDVTDNVAPITQFGTLAVSKLNPDILVGGTQDNGVVYFHLGTGQWFNTGGDGGGVGTHPYDENYLFATSGVYGGNITFRNIRKKNATIGEWEDINLGIGTTNQWGRLIKSDFNNPNTLYNSANNTIYRSFNNGNSWEILTIDEVPYEYIGSMSISFHETPNIYFTGSDDSKMYVHKMDILNLELINISSGLPSGIWDPISGQYVSNFVHTFPSEVLKDHVFVVIRGLGYNSKKVFVSNNNGVDWKNITGNLPNLPYTCLQVHPYDPNVMIIGTDGFGVYHTNDGGNIWTKWSENIPLGAIITDMDYYQSPTDSVFVFLSTYGNGIYKRYLPSNDVSLVKNNFKNNPLISEMYYHDDMIFYTVNFQYSKSLSINVYDISGKIVFTKKEISNDIGNHTEKIASLLSGSYVAVISSGNELAEVLKFSK